MSSWDDADERERPSGFGGDWRGARPTFDDPMSWSFAVLRVAGITVRLHVFFLVFILVVLAHAASVTSEGAVGVLPTMLGLVALFAVILLHEFGHCFACRRKGGTADEILLWPLGGLATCNPPERPGAHLWTALGGPLVNVAIIAVLTPAIGIWTGGWWGRAIPNPLDLGGMIQRADFGEDLVGWAQMFAFLTNYIAWVLLLFNLIPMFPLDGGRILQAVLWRRVGYAASMRIACRAGIVGAVAIGVGALVAESTMLLGIAVFGGFVCVATARHIDHERDFLGFEPDPSELAAMEEELDEPRERPRGGGVARAGGGDSSASGRPSAGATGASSGKSSAGGSGTAGTGAEAEIDRILAKIARSGIESLTADERGVLQRATDERRGRERRNG
jgi:Zn-dependent protease